METVSVASEQYNDMKGTVALDFHESIGGLFDLAQKCGVDVKEYWPLSLTIGVGTASGEDYFLTVTIYAAEQSLVGSKAEDVVEYAASHNNTVPTTRFEARLTLREFASFAKRFQVILHTKGYPNLAVTFET